MIPLELPWYFQFCNIKRFHQSIGYQTPEEMYPYSRKIEYERLLRWATMVVSTLNSTEDCFDNRYSS